MTEIPAFQKLEVLQTKQESSFEKVRYDWSQIGAFYCVTATVRGISTKRMFRIEPDDPRSEKEQFIEQALKIQDDVIKRFEFIYKCKTGQMGNITFNE